MSHKEFSAIVILLSVLLLGALRCAPTTIRRALVTTTAAVQAVAGEHSSQVCDLVETQCAEDPCDALLKCHEAQVLLRAAAVYWARGAKALNEVIPDGDK